MSAAARAPMAPLALAFATGIAAAPVVPAGLAWALVVIGLVWGLSLVALDRPGVAVACLLGATAAAGALRATPPPLAPDHVARLPLPLTATVEGTLAGEPRRLAPDRTRLLVAVERVGSLPRSGRVLVTLRGEPPPLAAGQRVRAELALAPPVGFRNPGVHDHGARLRREGIHAVAGLRADRLLVLDDPRPAWPVRVRRAIRDLLARSLPPASAALLAGLLMGDRTDLPRDLDDRFRAAGIYHVLAVSGFNVALVAGSAFALLLLARAGRRTAAAGAMAVVVAYALVAGPEPSVLRAAVMGVLVLGAVLLDRDASLLNSLALAALLVLAARPADLLDPGFQMSFAATLAIALAPLPRSLLAGALAVSAVAQAAVVPIALVHFNQLAPLGVLANLAAVPLAAAGTVLGLAGAALGLAWEPAGHALLGATWPVLLALRLAAAAVASLPGALLRLPAPTWPAVAAYVAALALACAWWRWRADAPRRALAGALGCAVVAGAVYAWPLLRPPDGRLRLTVLDVGQGDAIAVELPDGRAALIDAGPGGPHRLDAGERVVAPFLWNRGTLRLALAVVTHGDIDHAGGMPFVLRHFAPAQVWTPEHRPAGRTWLGGVAVLPIGGPAGTRNEGALVLRIDHGLASFLLTSDIGGPGEARLLASGAPLAAAVLKVPHHGSRHSSTPAFLSAVGARLAVVSVGARNPYRHPAPEALARVAAGGARIYRTDRDGAVLFETDGAVLTVTRWATRTTERFCLDPDAACDG